MQGKDAFNQPIWIGRHKTEIEREKTKKQPGASRISNQGGFCEDPLHAGSLASKDKGKEKTEHYGQTSQW